MVGNEAFRTEQIGGWLGGGGGVQVPLAYLRCLPDWWGAHCTRLWGPSTCCHWLGRHVGDLMPGLPEHISTHAPLPMRLPAGKEGTRAGKVNWAALSRHLGFATPATVHKQYNSIRGIQETPGAGKKKKRAEEENGVEAASPAATPAAKKPKTEPKAEEPKAAPKPAAAAVVPPGGWAVADDNKLVKLVEQKTYRKEVGAGSRGVRWVLAAGGCELGAGSRGVLLLGAGNCPALVPPTQGQQAAMEDGVRFGGTALVCRVAEERF